jgi:hypothetical protein
VCEAKIGKKMELDGEAMFRACKKDVVQYFTNKVEVTDGATHATHATHATGVMDLKFFEKSNSCSQPQNTALSYATRNGNLPVFAFQYCSSPARKYIVGCYARVFSHIGRTRDTERGFYELIIGPCNLYMDVEYAKGINLSMNEADFVASLKLAIIDGFMELFATAIYDGDIFVSDSSYTKKFSIHVTVNCKSAIFANMGHAGRFVKWLIRRNEERLQSPNPPAWARSFSINIEENGVVKKGCAVDMGVYTKHRLMRTLWSTKLDQLVFRPFIPVGSGPDGLIPDMGCFLKSLVCHVDSPEKLSFFLTVNDNLRGGMHRIPEAPVGDGGSSPTAPTFRSEFEYGGVLSSGASSSNGISTTTTKIPRIASSTTPVAPAPAQAFSRLFRNATGVAIEYDPSKATILAKTRENMCEIAGRRHGKTDNSGNHIYYVVFLLEGTYVQKCPSSSCTGKMGKKRALPKEFEKESNELLTKHYTPSPWVGQDVFMSYLSLVK